MPSADPATRKPALAVFASEQGPGDPERASIMSVTGSLLARRGARIICLAHGKNLCIPLIISARAAGGEVRIIADEDATFPQSLSSVPIERIADEEGRLNRIAELADLYVGLPGSLASTSDLYRSWVRGGGGAAGKAVVLLNRNRAFEVMRGMAADVVSHSVKRSDRLVQFTDSVDDLWNKISWALNETGHQVA